MDVAAIGELGGLLIQCKASTREDQALGWQAVRDLAAGAPAYARQCPGLPMCKLAITNQSFDEAARAQAALHEVGLIDRSGLLDLLDRYPLSRQALHLAAAR